MSTQSSRSRSTRCDATARGSAWRAQAEAQYQKSLEVRQQIKAKGLEKEKEKAQMLAQSYTSLGKPPEKKPPPCLSDASLLRSDAHLRAR